MSAAHETRAGCSVTRVSVSELSSCGDSRDPMAPLSLVVAAAALRVAVAQSQCLPSYQCNFQAEVGGKVYAWDLSQLCRDPGSEYVATDSLNHTVSFNVRFRASGGRYRGRPHPLRPRAARRSVATRVPRA